MDWDQIDEEEWREYLLKAQYEEAQFFLDKITGCRNHEIEYYLSAFLGAVYSISEYMSKQHATFDTWATEKYQQDLHRYMMDNRNNFAHLHKPSKAEPKFGRIPITFLWIPDGRIYFFWLLPDSVTKKHADLVTGANSAGGGLLPVDDLCTMYFDSISKWINDESNIDIDI